MLKRRSKTIAILTAFIFCLTFLGAAFIAPPVAEAAFTATVAQSNYVAAAPDQNLGYIKVEVNVADWSTVSGDQLLVSYPTRIGTASNELNVAGVGGKIGAVGTDVAVVPVDQTHAAAVAQVGDPTAPGAAIGAYNGGLGLAGANTVGDSGIRVVVPADADNAFDPSVAPLVPDIAVSPYSLIAGGNGSGLARNGAFTIALNPTNNPLGVARPTKEKGWFYIYFSRMDTSNFAGDIDVSLVPQSGTAFGTLPNKVVVGKVETTKTTTTVAKSVTKVPSNGGPIDTITIFENMPNTIGAVPPALPQNITLKLTTKGYWFDTTGATTSKLFAFAPAGAAVIGNPVAGAGAQPDNATVTVTAVPGAGSTTTGAIAIGGLVVRVDEKVAKIGQDIEIKVSGAGVTEQTIVVAQYVDFIANVIEDTTTEMTAGLDGQKIGTFFIEEVAPGTLIANRTILFELPAGVEWNTANISNSNYEMANNSAMNFTAGNLLDARTLKFAVNTGSGNAQNGAKVKFKSLKVDVSPSFTGDVVLTVKGKAGVEGTAKVATVNPMITMTASAPEVNLGIKEQKVSDVEIVETKADTIVARNTGNDQDMAFYLDQGFRFAKLPKVEVIEGDMVIEVNDVKIQAPANQQNLLIVPIRAASYKTPAKIKISDIYVTADRNAPVGDVILYAADTNTYPQAPGLCNAFNSTGRASFRYDTPASVAIAKNVTVPPVETKGTIGGGSGTFVIGSNIYTVNGLTKIMDVAPYINNGRTFVPYRFLALALGVAEDDIVWDDATKKVTVTKGDIVVEGTIGSTTLTVNGEAVTMDVAPEIKNGRTMLPARYLTEALGGSVGWDQATKTVVFEM